MIEKIHFREIDSTQKYCWRLYEEGINNILISADIQTNGVGTHGRVWYTEENNNIAFSILLNVSCNINKFDNLTYRIAEIIKTILKENYQININIKEPNDLVINNKKLGGILLETKLSKDIVKCIVLGIGINNSQINFNKDIELIATSLYKEFNKKIDVNEFIDLFYLEFISELKRRNII